MFRARAARAARASSKSTRIQKKSTWISRKSVVIAFFSAHDRSTWNPCMTHVESLYDPRGIPVRSTRITNPRGFPRGYPCNYFQLGVYMRHFTPSVLARRRTAQLSEITQFLSRYVDVRIYRALILRCGPGPGARNGGSGMRTNMCKYARIIYTIVIVDAANAYEALHLSCRNIQSVPIELQHQGRVHFFRTSMVTVTTSASTYTVKSPTSGYSREQTWALPICTRRIHNLCNEEIFTITCYAIHATVIGSRHKIACYGIALAAYCDFSFLTYGSKLTQTSTIENLNHVPPRRTIQVNQLTCQLKTCSEIIINEVTARLLTRSTLQRIHEEVRTSGRVGPAAGKPVTPFWAFIFIRVQHRPDCFYDRTISSFGTAILLRCIGRLLRGHTLLASPPELDIFFRTRCLVPSCECGSRFCRRWQVPSFALSATSCECGSRFRRYPVSLPAFIHWFGAFIYR
ncbi:unnamed protein product, partial [Trichogramma brassicae]